MTDLTFPLQPLNDPQLPDAPPVAADKDAFIAALRALGIASVQIEYNGYGDEGGVETITAVTADNSEVDLKPHQITPPEADAPISLHEALEEFAWTAVQYFHGGFHNNEGGNGTVTIHTDTGTVKIEHNDNVVETLYSENEF